MDSAIFGPKRPLVKIYAAAWRRVLEVNIIGTESMVPAVVPASAAAATIISSSDRRAD